MPLITKLERKFGWIAIPGLLRIIAFLNLVFFVLQTANPDFLDFLLLDWTRVKSGEVWRLLTVFLIPQMSPLWLIFAVLFLIFIGDSLERAWGAFTVTLYFLAGIVTADVAWIVTTTQLGQPELLPRLSGFIGFVSYESVFLAFCVCYPEVTIRLLGILPVKAWILGVVGGVTLLTQMLNLPGVFWPAVLFSLANFFVFAAPKAVRHLRQRQAVWDRRSKFEKNKLPTLDHFYRCKVCGRTDRTNPELDFRVAEDDEEYCFEHLPVAKLPKAE